ncbi:ankyrin-2b isoform X2 [Cottoperca gobio]|uniref:Ankyrin-2b isoform X2 n=1 Tax=Cottoperca gobio TaxID=56716 RepID=A0A6J2RK90_COTGO|nr:uncharacterized protein LOC115023496 isoform X2 [Cottoperca gobio]
MELPETDEVSERMDGHLDEVSRRLYTVLYGYNVELMDSDSEDVSLVPMDASPEDIIQGRVREELVDGTARHTNVDEDCLNPVLEIDVSQVLLSGDLDVKSLHSTNQTDTATPALAGPSDVSCIIPCLMSQKPEVLRSTGFIQVSHDSSFELIDAHSVDNTMSDKPRAVYSFEKTLSFRQNESGVVVSVGLVHDRSSSSECVTDTAILLTESRGSSPESVSSVNELHFLASGPSIPQFRPLSPLPPPVFPWETGDVGVAEAQGQILLCAPGNTSMLLRSESEERPLTPMVSNKRPFGRPLSLGSDYSVERSISPQSLTFDIEERTSSPESAILETMQCFFESSEHVTLSPDFHEIRPSSLKSSGYVTAHCRLPLDSPITELGQVSESFTTCQCRSSSPESVSSDLEFETPLLLSKSFEDRLSSPQSVASVNEYKALSPDSPVPEFSHNWPGSIILMIGERFTSAESVSSDVEYGSMSPALVNYEDRAPSPAAAASGDDSESVLPVTGHKSFSPESVEKVCDSIHADHRRKSPETLVSDTENKPPTPVESVFEDDGDWVVGSACDTKERPLSPDSVPGYRTMSHQSAMLDIRASSPESETFNEYLSTDSPIPQYTPSVHHTVTINDHSSSPESMLSDTEYEAMPLLSYFENRPLSPDSSGSVSDYRLYPVTNLPLEENMTLELTQAAVVVDEACVKKQFETKTNKIVDLEKSKSQERYSTFILSKPEESPMKHNETKAPTIQSVAPDGSQSDQNTVTPLARVEVLSAIKMERLSPDLYDTGYSKEEMYYPVTVKTKPVRKKKSRKSVKTDYEPVTKCKKESSESIATYEEKKGSVKTLSPLMSQETASDDLPFSLVFSTNVPEGQQLPGESLVSVPQHHIPLSLTEYSVPVYSLTYNAELWKLISQIRDPQYVGETFMSKTGVFQFAETRAKSYQTKSDATVNDEAAALRSENDQRSLSPDSEAEYRPMSPQSLLVLDALRQDSTHLERSVDSQQALMPDSPIPQYFSSFSETSQIYHRSVSTDSLSDLDMETDVKMSFIFEDRPASPDSVTSVDISWALSPDSPIPDFRPCLSESVVIARLDRSQLSSEIRPSSPHSVVSQDDYRCDSPIPEFKTGLTESVSVIAHGSSSPESLVSDVKYTQSSEDIGICEQRPDSPESQLLETTERPLGSSCKTLPLNAIRVPAYRFVYDGELWRLISQIHDPQYVGETFGSKTGVFEYAGTRIEYVLDNSGVKDGELEGGVKFEITDSSDADVLQALQTKIEREESPVPEYRPLSPGELITESGVSIIEEKQSARADATFRVKQLISQLYDHHYVGDTEVQGKSFTPDFENEFRDLSPDSPVPEFGQPTISTAEYRSTLPESVCNSDIENEDGSFLSLSDDCRPQSPDSVASGDELSPDSPVPQFLAREVERFPLFVGFRSSSPGSDASDVDYAPLINSPPGTEDRTDSPDSLELEVEERPLSPDSESEYRPFSPASLMLISNFRSSSPESSGSLTEFRVLSPDSPIQEFRQMLQESLNTYMEYRSSSSLSVSSDWEVEMELSFLLLEDRPSSPESSASLSKYRRLSPDSPVPDFRQSLLETYPEFNAYRSLSPESEASEIEYAPLIPQMFDCEGRAESRQSGISDSDLRCLSPDSPLPQYTMSAPTMLGLRYGSISPASVYSEEYLETDLCIPWLFEDRAASPGSAASKDEFRPLSPDSPIPEFTQALQESSISHMYSRSSSPESVLSNFDEEIDLSFPMVIEDRSSPESLSSLSKYRRLSPDSPVPDFRQALLEMYPEFNTYRSLSPQSESSEIEYAPLIPQMFDCEGRAESRQSGMSDSELRCWSPDSPLPQYTMSAPTMLGVRYGSTSPGSVYSEEDLETDLCIPWLFEDRAASPGSAASKDEFRPLSPDSPIPEFTQALQELSISHMYSRSSSPESVLSNFDEEIDLSFPMVIEDRSSPESLSSLSKYRRLSPDSPVPDFRQALLEMYPEFNTYRSLSPQSESSEIEYAPLIPQMFDCEGRAESRQSGMSDSELRCWSPDSPLPQYTMSAPTMLGVRYRSTSPGSVYSEEDLETDLCIPWLFEDRAASPGSAASKDEFRPLSPDSPIPEFTQALQESSISHMYSRSSSPESVLSNFDEEIDLSFPMVIEDRSSPESLSSLSKYRRLSPDSPVPDFRQALLEMYPEFNTYRSLSPQSESSEIEYAPLIPQMFDCEGRAESRQSGMSDSELRCWSPDSPLPQYTMSAPTMLGVRYGSTSPGSVYSEEDLETDLCIPWLFEDRAASPGSAASKDEFRPLSPDSPIPEFTQALQELSISHMYSRSSSPESVLSNFDEEIDLSFPMVIEDRSSPESLSSLSKYRRLSPDSPVPDFRQALLEMYPEFNTYRSLSPQSESSEIEYAPLIPQMFDCEGRAESRQSGMSDSELRCWSPDSPLPQYTMSAPTMLGVRYRSTSPGSVYSEEDLETDLCIPWLFEDRAASPGSAASKDEFRPLSPDSPIPEFTQALQQSSISHIYSRSFSPESVSSDFEMELLFPSFLENRPSSLESASIRLSPDSPLPDFMQPMFGLPETFYGHGSASPESTCSDIEYIGISVGSLVYDHRLSSPGSGASGDEYQGLSPDSPIPEYRPAMPERVIVNIGYRSSSPESTESDIEYALSEFLMSMNYSVEDRPDSPESVESEVQDMSLSVEFTPEYKPLSPVALMLLGNVQSVSPESTQFLDEHTRLSPDSHLPWFTQHFLETIAAETHILISGCSSPESKLSDKECGCTSLDVDITGMRPLSPQSERSDDQCKPLKSESPIPDFTKTFVENIMTVRDMSPPEFLGSDDLSQTLDLCCTVERSASPEYFESDKKDTVLSTTMATTSPENSTIMAAEYNLIYEHDLIATVLPLEGTHMFTSTNTATSGDSFFCTSGAQVISDIPILISESPPPVIEHILSSGAAPYRQTKYTFAIPSPEAQTETDDGWVFVSVSDTEDDDLCYSPGSLIENRPISLHSVMVMDARASSPDFVTSVNEFRPLSPVYSSPEFTVVLPEYITFLRSASSSPETLASDIDYVPFENVESQFEECRPSSPDSALLEDQHERERPLSSESLPEYRPMLLESAMQMGDKRASSPESMPEFNENRSLSPDSPIPQFTVLLEYTTTYRSSSPESMGSDSECEFMVISSIDDEIDRPSSHESISFVNEFEHLLPDSPVPDFMRILSSYFSDATLLDRSSSPVSLSSDCEFVALPINCWIDDSPRPLSPQTESEEELGFCCEDTDLLSHMTSPFLPSQSSSLLSNKGQFAVSPLVIQTSEIKSQERQINPDWQKITGPEVLSYEWMQRGSEAESISTLQTMVCKEDFQKDFPVKPSPVQDPKIQERKILHISAAELQNKTSSQRAPPQTPEETLFRTAQNDGVQSKVLSATEVTQDSSKLGLVFTDDKPMKSVPLQLPDCELSPYKEQSTQFLVPPDFEAVFSGHQTLRVSEWSQTSLNDLNPVFRDSMSAQVVTEATTKGESENAEDYEFSPDFNRVLSDFEKTVSEFEAKDPKVLPKEFRKGSESPQHSDSDVEFFDCIQAISPTMSLEHEIPYHISEPPSPRPGSSPDVDFLKGSPQFTAHPFLRVEDYKRFSFGSESLSEFAYDSEDSRECRREGRLPVCEELPSRDQTGYYDDDDFLGREIAEELGSLSSDSSEEEVLTTRVVRRRVIIQADNLPDIPPQTITEEKYTDDHGNMVVKKITRKVIRKYVSPDGMETQEVTIEGSQQETVQIEEGDIVSRVVKRTVLHSEGDQKELTFSEPLAVAVAAATASEFEVEPVQGRKVSKVVKTTVVRGERMEKQTGDSSLAANLPSARKDFEKKPDV